MPAFRQFQPRELSALSAFLKTPPSSGEERSWRSASGPLHHRRLPVVPRSPWSAGYRAALGHIERHRSRQGRHRVEGPAWRVPGARQEGHSQHRDAQLRRSRGDGRRHHRHCRDGRREDSRLREELWSSAVGTSASRWRLRHAEHLHDRRPAVHRHRGRRQRQERDEVRRLDHRLRAAAGPPANPADHGERRASRGQMDRPLRRKDPGWLGAHERRPPFHRGGRRDRGSDGRVQRQPELIPVLAAGI